MYNNEDDFNLREELGKYLKFWPWFILGVILSLGIGFVYLKLATPKYKTVASVIIKDDEKNAPAASLESFSELGLLGGMGSNKIENEIGIFQSYRMMQNTVKALKLNVAYFNSDNFVERELYLESPYLIEFLSVDNNSLKNLIRENENKFYIEKNNSDNSELIVRSNEGAIIVETNFNSIVDLGFGEVLIKRNRDYSGEVNKISIFVSTVNMVADGLRDAIKVAVIEKNATLLELNIETAVRQKGQDILNQLIFEYNKEAIKDKNEIAVSTAQFIDERLQIISEELDTVEVGLEEFKENNSLTNIEAESTLYIENASEYRKRVRELSTQLEYVESLLDFIDDKDEADLLPGNIALENTSVNEQIQKFNNLLLQRNRILEGATSLNPSVQRLDGQIGQMSKTIYSGLKQYEINLEMTLNELNSQSNLISSEISKVPSKERQFRDISRQQNIKEALYIFLLQKREENSLSLAATSPKAKIVDSAYSSNRIVSPKSSIIFFGSFLIGILIPFLIIYIRRLLNNKIERREDLEKITRAIPIVGELPRIAKGDSDLIEENDRSVLAESFRILTTNLQYLLVNAKNEDKGYCLYTTSTVKGEGKTFTSINLAMTLANTGKKVVLIGADLRNPQLQRYDTESKSLLGVSDYLVNDDHKLESLIHDSKFHPNLKLFLSGSIPPNPSELLRQSKFGRMLDELREQYDYVIVDTAPSMLVADTFLISKYADLILYVTRAGYTEKRLINFAVDSQQDGKLHDISFVINDVKTANFGYGNKYGYAYGQDKPSLWERFKSSF
ncbi:capsular exopolysaccharide synthesis family protein [Leeuwenhoekiella aestuarii]|uniref:GumC family protein n=1 Tax=Leeuwenhoekiella aestuarii TaxID=2249426 RepID=UPI0010287AD3|nr:polysaccharide biosynthesis tyrosine autokinase [Leeuwenhoekiella aestuarii]RXG12914.1 capsular exopolysaccharide synthesis family protein [Leeuwenhoekiella aestuarii]